MTAVTVRVLALLLLSAAVSSAAGEREPLYVRLGGEAGVTAIAGTLIDRVARDPALGASFKDSNLERIKNKLAEQICDLSGGPCHYSGDSMKETHAGHHISEADFYGMVEELRVIMKERQIDQRASNELLRLLAPMKRDVVDYKSVIVK